MFLCLSPNSITSTFCGFIVAYNTLYKSTTNLQQIDVTEYGLFSRHFVIDVFYAKRQHSETGTFEAVAVPDFCEDEDWPRHMIGLRQSGIRLYIKCDKRLIACSHPFSEYGNNRRDDNFGDQQETKQKNVLQTAQNSMH